MPPKSMKDKMEAEVRKLARLDGNKTCADCTERVFRYFQILPSTVSDVDMCLLADAWIRQHNTLCFCVHQVLRDSVSLYFISKTSNVVIYLLICS